MRIGQDGRLGSRKWSVRSRILSSTLVVAAIGLAISGGTAYFVQRDRTLSDIDDRLTSRIEVAQMVIDDGRIDTLSCGGDSVTESEHFVSTADAVCAILARVLPDRHESALGVIDGAPSFIPGVELDFHLEDDPDFVARVIREVDNGGVVLGSALTTVGTLRYVASPVRVEGSDESGIYLVAVDVDAELAELNAVFQTYALVAFLSLLAIAFVSWFVAGRLLRPIRNLREAASRITASELDERIPVLGRDDVSDLTGTVNDMLDRLQLALTSQRQLLDDVRHELMTPITIVRGHLELLETGRPADIEATRLLAIDELDRMTGLVNDIEAFAENQVVAPHRERVRADDLQATVFAKASAIAGHHWELGETTDAEAWLDRDRITQAWLQLIDNAAKYSPTDSRVVIGTTASPTEVQFWVLDEGPGIPRDARERIFERFGRVDPGRGIRGSGLGLPIVVAIAKAHGGRVDLRSSRNGSRFSIVLPRADSRQGAPGGDTGQTGEQG